MKYGNYFNEKSPCRCLLLCKIIIQLRLTEHYYFKIINFVICAHPPKNRIFADCNVSVIIKSKDNL